MQISTNTTPVWRALVAAIALACGTPAGALAQAWSEVTWHGERARASESAGWRAIVSIDRARLVHFGPADDGGNLLFAPATRDDPNGWGGHRVWLGPQAEWPSVWPPDPAWEASAAASYSVEDGVLTLVLPESQGGWANVTRSYAWEGDALACTVHLRGGSHAAQVIQIVQVPSNAHVRVSARPDAETPAGFVVLEIGARDQVRRTFPAPAGVTREADDALVLQPAGVVEKLGFAPQELRAALRGCELTLGPTRESGRTVGPVDAGFTTQVYLGREGVPFLELEQLSARFAPGENVSATILLRAHKSP